MNWFKLWGVIAATGASLAFAACSSSSNNTNADGGTGTDDGGGGGDGGGGDDGSSSGGSPYAGQIRLSVSNGKASGAASFQKIESDSLHCQTSTVGPCHVLICPDSPLDTDGGATPVSAGTITIAGGSAPLTLNLSSVSGVYQSSATNVTFTAGATATVSATGGDVPAFDGKTTKVPGDITVTDSYDTIDFTKDAVMKWSGGTDGKVAVNIVVADTSTATISCQFDATAGTGTIPKDAFKNVPSCADSGNALCTYEVVPVSSATFTAGEYGITFEAHGDGQVGTFTNP